jgi:diaminopimelate epimerase
MGEPILEGAKVPTTLAPTQGSTVVKQSLAVEGRSWAMTCVSMGNPHAITYCVDGQPIKVCVLVCACVLVC